MYEGMLIECSGSVNERNFRISLIRFCRHLSLFPLYSRKDSELPTTPGSDLGCEYMLDAIEMLLLRVDNVDIVRGLRRRDSSLSALLPFMSERQPSVHACV